MTDMAKLKALHFILVSAMMVATSTEQRKKEWRDAMLLSEEEQTALIRLFNAVGDLP